MYGTVQGSCLGLDWFLAGDWLETLWVRACEGKEAEEAEETEKTQAFWEVECGLVGWLKTWLVENSISPSRIGDRPSSSRSGL